MSLNISNCNLQFEHFIFYKLEFFLMSVQLTTLYHCRQKVILKMTCNSTTRPIEIRTRTSFYSREILAISSYLAQISVRGVRAYCKCLLFDLVSAHIVHFLLMDISVCSLWSYGKSRAPLAPASLIPTNRYRSFRYFSKYQGRCGNT